MMRERDAETRRGAKGNRERESGNESEPVEAFGIGTMSLTKEAIQLLGRGQQTIWMRQRRKGEGGIRDERKQCQEGLEGDGKEGPKSDMVR